jgi:hypothetical protein
VVRDAAGAGRAALVVGGGAAVTVARTFGPVTGSGSGTDVMLVIDGGAWDGTEGDADVDGGGSSSKGDDAVGVVTRGGGGKSDFELFALSRNATASAQIDNVAAAEKAATTMARRLRRLSSST